MLILLLLIGLGLSISGCSGSNLKQASDKSSALASPSPSPSPMIPPLVHLSPSPLETGNNYKYIYAEALGKINIVKEEGSSLFTMDNLCIT